MDDCMQLRMNIIISSYMHIAMCIHNIAIYVYKGNAICIHTRLRMPIQIHSLDIRLLFAHQFFSRLNNTNDLVNMNQAV